MKLLLAHAVREARYQPILQNLFCAMNEVQSQRKIVHLDEMDQEEFDRFASGEGSYEISEKVDGQNMSFGVDAEGRFFTKTKNSDPVYDPSFYDDIPYLSGFGDFHRAVQNTRTVELMRQSGETIQIFAELLPYAHSNTIEYSESAVGENGSVVVFNVESSTEKFEDVESFADQFAVAANGFNVTSKEVIDIPLVLGEGDDPSAVKSEIIQKLNELYDSALGAEKPEGYVIRNEATDQVVKLVDKSEFTEQNKKNHRFSNKIKKANRRFKINVRQQVFENADVLTQFEKAKQKVADEFTVRKQNGQGEFENIGQVLEVLVQDMDDEGHVPSYKEAAEIVTQEYVNWNEKMVEAENGFNESGDELSEISKDVTRHKIQSSKDRIDEIVESFASDSDWTSLVQASLGPTRVRRLRKQFVS